MILNFILSNLNILTLAIWTLFFVVVALRFVRPSWVKNIPFRALIVLAFSLHILYGVFISWGQYHVWAMPENEMGKLFLSAPLAPEGLLPSMLEWTRPFFAHPLGYFAYYVLGRFWINIGILFLVTGLFYGLFKFWNSRRGNFTPEGPELLFVLMLISGWPGVLFMLLIGFIIALCSIVISRAMGKPRTIVEPAFLAASFVALEFTLPVLDHFHLYTFLTV